jgi:hypothetical protein
MGALAGSALAPASRPRARHLTPRSAPHHLPAPVKAPAAAFGAVAVGTGVAGPLAISALAVGAVALGALAVGALTIGRLGVRKARFQDVEIDSLTVRRLHILEETDSSETAP